MIMVAQQCEGILERHSAVLLKMVRIVNLPHIPQNPNALRKDLGQQFTQENSLMANTHG